MKITEKELEQDLILAKNIFTHGSGTIFVTNYYDQNRPYWATTQNLTYIPDLTKKVQIASAFTITGSSDNIMELVGTGVSDIVGADINPFAKYIFYLKKAAMKTLDVKEYIRFILEPHTQDFLADDIFRTRVMYGFDKGEELYCAFWDIIFRLYSRSQILHFFFKPDFSFTRYSARESCMTYTQRKKYQRIQEQIPHTNFTFYEEDALAALEKETKLFGFIDITNILLFVFQKSCHCNIDEFRSYIQRLEAALKGHLTSDGIFVVDYMFNRLDLKNLLKESQPTGNEITDRVNSVSASIYQILNECFDIIALRYRGIVKATDDFIVSKTPDQVLLAKLKK